MTWPQVLKSRAHPEAHQNNIFHRLQIALLPPTSDIYLGFGRWHGPSLSKILMCFRTQKFEFFLQR